MTEENNTFNEETTNPNPPTEGEPATAVPGEGGAAMPGEQPAEPAVAPETENPVV